MVGDYGFCIWSHCFPVDGDNVSAKNIVSISNVGDVYRAFEYHVGTYHSLEILWIQPADHVIGMSGSPICSDLEVGETRSVAFGGLNYCGGMFYRASVVVVENTTAVEWIIVFSRGAEGESVVRIEIWDIIEVPDEGCGQNVCQEVLLLIGQIREIGNIVFQG